MLAGTSAAAALVALGVAVGSRRRALAPLALTLAAAVSLVASLLIALGYGGRADALVLIEAVAMIALIFFAVREAPGRQARHPRGRAGRPDGRSERPEHALAALERIEEDALRALAAP